MSLTDEQIKEAVREGYTRAVESRSSCCSSADAERVKQVAGLGYATEELENLPAAAVESSFGCGNPLAFTGVEKGDVVLDIGSGAGIDCLIAAEKVGPEGKVIGLDMTPAMIERARVNAREAGADNVEFRMGEADDMPVESDSVDWVISNCVINLAPDKGKVFREVARILKPGGRVSISDIVLGDDLPQEVVSNVDALVGCVAGAIKEGEYLEAMQQAGLVDVEVTERMVYGEKEIEGFLGECCQPDVEDGEGESSCCGSGKGEARDASGCCGSSGDAESSCCGSEKDEASGCCGSDGSGKSPEISAECIAQVAGKVWSARITGKKS
jgi:arsenite methyltransferase